MDSGVEGKCDLSQDYMNDVVYRMREFIKMLPEVDHLPHLDGLAATVNQISLTVRGYPIDVAYSELANPQRLPNPHDCSTDEVTSHLNLLLGWPDERKTRDDVIVALRDVQEALRTRRAQIFAQQQPFEQQQPRAQIFAQQQPLEYFRNIDYAM